ncbi:hypothetical protein D0962_04140 [Leptolyngbyaceae cyanobacterium CCMR0082]|uniref:Uncharacterized protein n=1 Tax=Adonisia turfae CCMR0082 TaxID=2304604 RepID=A0A6M0S167_9CYAN|nr:hypothetical protein [Adonisia turfae]NEZ61970.1 hypothetical protein [Adonisia turfae CCMR0082]
MTKPRIVVLIPNWNQLPDDYEVHQQAKGLGWYSSYTDEVPEIPGFRPVDELSTDGKLKRQGPWIISETPQSYEPGASDNYYEGVHTCICDYQPLPEVENPWMPVDGVDLSALGDDQLTDMGVKPEQFDEVRNRESVGV